VVETTSVNVPSGDFPFSVVGRWPRSPLHAEAWACVWSIDIGELSVGEALEAAGVVARVYVLPCSCSREVDAEGGRTKWPRLWIFERGEGAIRVAYKAVCDEVRVYGQSCDLALRIDAADLGCDCG
jgi:hypothetical protein